MITTGTNNLRVFSPTLFDLMPSLGALEDFPPAAWATGPTQFEEFVQLEIPRSNISIPKQLFRFRFSPNRELFTLESVPSQGWPQILLELKADARGNYQVSCFDVNPAVPTLIAQMKFTRFVLSLVDANACLFGIGLDVPLRLSFAGEALANEDLQHLYRRAKVARKLGFLEKVFHCKFDYPLELSRQTVFQIETLFRGITEGRFSVRLESLNLIIDPKTVDLSQPPWKGSGSIKQMVSEHETLFGTTLDTGSVWLEALHAEIGSYQAIRQIEQRVTHPVKALFGILDHQVTFCYERYANRSLKEREAKLKQYLHELSLEEPSSIYNLTIESLISDVTEKEADILSMGWLSIHRFHDRYCSQTPEFDVAKNQWRVPLWLTYPSGKGGPLATLFVDAKTGIVTSSLPIPEIKIRGKQLAQQLLHASETALSQTGD